MVGGLETTTGEDGGFVLEGLPEGTDLFIFAEHESYMSRSWNLEPGLAARRLFMTPRDSDLRVASGITCRLQGVVRDPEGKPSPGVELRLTVNGEHLGKNIPAWCTPSVLAPEDAFAFDAVGNFICLDRTRSDSEGNFSFECGIPGLARVETVMGGSFATVPVELGGEYGGLSITVQ